MKISPDIQNLIPYAPGKPIEETKRELGLKQVYKLASNENPLGPSPKAVLAMQAELTQVHRYPDPSSFELRNFLSTQWKLPAQQILIGSGSNELIDLLIRVYCEPGDKVIVPEKSFIAYSICAQAARVQVLRTPVNSDLKIDVNNLVRDLKSNFSGAKILFLANPNNPTGTYLNRQDLEEILAVVGGREDILVVVDEAYNEFVRAQDYPEMTSYLEKYKNLLILRTFSKVYGLAGLRVGALIAADPQHLNWIHRVRMPFNVNSLAQKAVIAAMGDQEYIAQSQKIVWDGLDYFYKELNSLGLKFIPSQANFVLLETGRDASEVFQECLRQGVILRSVKEYGLPTHLRMSVGLAEENTAAIQALSHALFEVRR